MFWVLISMIALSQVAPAAVDPVVASQRVSRAWDQLVLPAGWAADLQAAPVGRIDDMHVPSQVASSPVALQRVPRAWDGLVLPDGWAADLQAAPVGRIDNLHVPSQVASSAVALQRVPHAWDRLVLPDGWAAALEAAPVLPAVGALPAAPAPAPVVVPVPLQPDPQRVALPRRACPICREIHQYDQLNCRDLCFCGLRHRPNFHCDGVAVDSALKIHHYLSTHSSPAVPVHHLGTMERLCPHCHAQFFKNETINCCQRGTVCVPIPEVPAHVHSLICSRPVLSQIRVYNMAMAMASTGHKNMSPDWGMFTMGGKSYHRLSANFQNPRGPPAFAQIYMLDTTAATARRLQLFPQARSGSSLDASVLAQLHDTLLACNPWIGRFHTAGMNNLPELCCGAKFITSFDVLISCAHTRALPGERAQRSANSLAPSRNL